MIPKLDMSRLLAGDTAEIAELRRGAQDVGFLVVRNTALSADDVASVIAAYRAFFHLPTAEKARVDMALTGSNRGWGAPQSERVDPAANPDYKEVFDCGFQLAEDDPLSELSVYAPNLWPDLPGFRKTVQGYYRAACGTAMDILRVIAAAIGENQSYFDDKFDRPMALLRGNFYPERPDWAGDRDFGIAAHTDYGCLTLLASDGVPGLEVQGRDGGWLPVTAEPGEFVINFGEMLEMWTGGRVKATLHRVRGSSEERISVPLFFNPNHDANVAPEGDAEIRAGDHLAKRFNETYLHLAKA
ncbi:isopenicillin N synthase family dioxygenase [Pseudooceanicola onchidii]|uniref:isopenicillin N synthase family dioxygenase n=1 Tax=Pseudooceanicola onchidii TaxID=2562279 RepID=UPI0010AA6807|nr:2-oxoglutarate and iron-dependent oxygenase domain-containing protein [Pseudooceanicola onchidii]